MKLKMMTEDKIRELLKEKLEERKKINNNIGKTGNKGHHLPYLSVECDLLYKILE